MYYSDQGANYEKIKILSFVLALVSSLTMTSTFYSAFAQADDEYIQPDESVTVYAPSDEIKTTDEIETFLPILDANVIAKLEYAGIDYTVDENNQIIMTDPSEENLEKWNLISNRRRASYPSSWYSLPNYTFYTSKKFQNELKTTAVSVVSQWAFGFTSSAKQIGSTILMLFGTQYFVNSGTSDIFYKKEYSYREMGSGWFDNNGNYYGNYQMKVVEFTSPNYSMVPSQSFARYQDTTTISAFF